jgi:hypothetical protein
MNLEIDNSTETAPTNPKLAEVRVIYSSNPQSEGTMTPSRGKEPLMKRSPPLPPGSAWSAARRNTRLAMSA